MRWDRLRGEPGRALRGCTVGPDFSPPAEPTTKGYTSTGNGLIERESSGPTEVQQHVVLGKNIVGDWWTLFHSPTLDGLLEQALANNRTLAAAKATLKQARHAVAQAAGAYYPQVDLGAGASRQRTNLATQGFPPATSEFNLYSLGPTVSFDLDPFGGNRRRVEQQAALAEVQNYQLDAAYLTLTGNVVTEVVNIAASWAQIRAVEEIIANDERNLELVRTETRAGELTRVDIETAAAQLTSDRTLLPPLRQQLSLAGDALAVLLAKAPGDWVAPTFALTDLALPQELPLSLPSELVHRRPDILASEAQLHATSAAIGVATAQLYPDITLSASLAQETLNPTHIFMPASTIWSLAAKLMVPIFHGGALEAQRRGAESGFEAALANYEQTVLQAFGQVADILHALAYDAQLVQEERRALNAAQSALSLTRKTLLLR
jgi:NodT family efflux transporter outer membrane factor (OMF) lipoprotein